MFGTKAASVIVLVLCLNLVYVESVTLYDVRLNGGSTAYQGTVEVLTYRGWLPLCYSRYRSTSSLGTVLCRQLGYTPYSSRSGSSLSGNSTRFYFSCFGTESDLLQCSRSSYAENTYCSYILNVVCSSCTHGAVQLRGGIVPKAGTVEYCDNGEWKAVCDSNWDYKDAFVVCRQLGYPATDAVNYYDSYFGNHLSLLDSYFNCYGNESSLSHCQSVSRTSCNRVTDAAGVYCTGDTITARCINGHIRLAGGRDMYEGRIEICSNGVWGTIWGGINWDSLDAQVVCRQLGFYQPYARVEVFYNSYFGTGSGPVLYAYLNCDGTENTIDACSRTSSSSYPLRASHSADAGVRCNRITTTVQSSCANGGVRLVNGSTPYEGRVEICYDGVWGSICDSGWDNRDAAVVCLQLGFQGTNATALRGSYFGDGTGPYHRTNINCNVPGHHSLLQQCISTSNIIGYHTCSSNRDASVRCEAPCNHGDVRLFGGYTDHVGVAEVCINGQWGDICDDVANRTTIARIFCRQFTGEESPTYIVSSCCPATRQRNSGSTTLYGVSCAERTGIFTQDCSYQLVSGSVTRGCTLQEELVIGCYEQSSCTSGDIRLVNGSSRLEGKVELCSQGIWGSITTSSWDYRDAEVVCRQLEYPWDWAIDNRNSLFGRGSSRHVARNVHCSTSHQRFSNCSYTSITSGLGYESSNAAGVICQGNTAAPMECEHGDVRLVDGPHRAEGRVEVCAHGYWATACYNGWDIVETEIVCNQLNLPSEGSQYLSGSPFGSNYQLPIVRISCGAGANNISECQIYTRGSTVSVCNHRLNVGIRCQDTTQYIIKMDVFPAQESYDIGSTVTFNCTIHPTPSFNGDRDLPISYRWYSTYGTISSASTTTNTYSITIPRYHPHFVNYYCQPLIYGHLLGTQRITLNIKGILHRSKNTSDIQVIHEHDNVSLHVEKTAAVPTTVDILRSVLDLRWYHNGSVIAPNLATIGNMNKTLNITSFTPTDAGRYEVRYNEIFVHPYNELCKEETLSLGRHYPVLSPVVFCVNLTEEECSAINAEAPMRKISIKSMDSDSPGTLNTITIEATGTVLSSKELRHSSIWWYRNGRPISTSTTRRLSSLTKHQNTLSLSQQLRISDVTYEDTGSFEVLLIIDTNTYTRENTQCQPYYDRFISTYLRRYIILAQEQVDIGYYKGLTFSVTADKKAASRNEGATITCEASLQFPPFSMLSFIKNGLTVANSISGQLQIETKSVNVNPFGLYTCQLNASGSTYQKSLAFKEQASLRIVFNTDNQELCTDQLAKTAIEDELTSKIASECRCTFDKSDLYNSTTTCDNGELTYTTNVIYANDDGYETASIITERLVRQAPFTMTVSGTRVTATSACSDCDTMVAAASLSPAVGGGLFAAGFVVAAVLALIVIIVVVIAMKKKSATSDGIRQKPETSGDPVRYASSVKGKNAESAKQQTTNVSFQYQKEDYEEMNPTDQPIYEETF